MKININQTMQCCLSGTGHCLHYNSMMLMYVSSCYEIYCGSCSTAMTTAVAMQHGD